MLLLSGVIHVRDVNKDSSLKAKVRTKDSSFVPKDNQAPRTKAKVNMPADTCDSMIYS